jgi:hypothetical protein
MSSPKTCIIKSPTRTPGSGPHDPRPNKPMRVPLTRDAELFPWLPTDLSATTSKAEADNNGASTSAAAAAAADEDAIETFFGITNFDLGNIVWRLDMEAVYLFHTETRSLGRMMSFNKRIMRVSSQATDRDGTYYSFDAITKKDVAEVWFNLNYSPQPPLADPMSYELSATESDADCEPSPIATPVTAKSKPAGVCSIN